MTGAKGGNISDIYYCPHGPDENCECRKPKPGLLQQFSQDNKIDLAGIFCIGDSFRDLQAAWSVGANPLLVKTGKGQRTLEENPDLDTPVFSDLYAASQFIISQP